MNGFEDKLRDELVDASERQQTKKSRLEFLRHLSKKTIGLLGVATLGLAAAGIYYAEMGEETSVPGIGQTAEEVGNAGCKSLEFTKKSNAEYRFKPNIVITGGATFDSVLYRFDANNLSVVDQERVPDTDEHSHTFKKPGPHTVTAGVNYELNGIVFGGLPICEVQIEVGP